MAQFEAEVRTSLASIQTQLSQVQAKAVQASAAVASIGPSAMRASVATSTLGKDIGYIGKAANAAGGPVAGMIGKLGALASINPMFFAAGAGIGLITGAVTALVGRLQEASQAQAELNAAIAANPALTAEAGRQALADNAGALAAAERSAVLAEVSGYRTGTAAPPRRSGFGAVPRADTQIVAEAAAVGLTEDDIIAMESRGIDPRRAISGARARVRASPAGQASEAAAREVAIRSETEAAKVSARVAVATGTASDAQSLAVAREANPEIAKQLEALTAELRANREAARAGGFSFGNLTGPAAAEERYRETQAKVQALENQVIQTTRSGYR